MKKLGNKKHIYTIKYLEKVKIDDIPSLAQNIKNNAIKKL
mgnify:CR=1 FL=1